MLGTLAKLAAVFQCSLDSRHASGLERNRQLHPSTSRPPVMVLDATIRGVWKMGKHGDSAPSWARTAITQKASARGKHWRHWIRTLQRHTCNFRRLSSWTSLLLESSTALADKLRSMRLAEALRESKCLTTSTSTLQLTTISGHTLGVILTIS